MTFVSYAFWLFLSGVLVSTWVVPARFRNVLLLLASYAFYCFWDWRFLGVLVALTVIDFLVSHRIAATADGVHRKRLLMLSIGTTIGALGFFKYFDFFIGELSTLLHRLGASPAASPLGVVLPLGISYYAFTTLGYVVDVYRGSVPPVKRFTDYALFIAYFPKLVAGPIERAGGFLQQVSSPRRVTRDDFEVGFVLVLWGLIWKLVLADNFAIIVNGVYSHATSGLTGPEIWTATYAYAFQIYGDFWGYSAIALGVSRWLGFRLIVNFRTPYLARNPSEFWSRWHISLSTWLRDYVFLPLNFAFLRHLGERRWLGLGEEYWSYFCASLLTMLAAGVWHGAGWTFVLWGAYFGLLMCIHRAFLGWRRRLGVARRRVGTVQRVLSAILTFHAVCLGWVFFRAESAGQVPIFLARMFSDFRLSPLVAFGLVMIGLLAGPVLAIEYLGLKSADETVLLRSHWALRGAVYGFCILMILVLSPVVRNEFIYFRF